MGPRDFHMLKGTCAKALNEFDEFVLFVDIRAFNAEATVSTLLRSQVRKKTKKVRSCQLLIAANLVSKLS